MPLATKRMIAALGALHVLAGLVIFFGGYRPATDVFVRSSGMLAAHILAAALCLAIARDYPAESLLRRSWLLFSGESFCIGTRSLIQLGVIPAGAFQREAGSALISLGAMFMIAGMLTTTYALRPMGFSFHLYRRDVLCMLVLSTVLPLTLVQRYGWPPALDSTAATSITIFLTAIVSIPLLRFSRQMESAVLAQANVWIVTYMTVRCAYHLLSAMQGSGAAAGPVVEMVRYMIGYGAAWLFSYATALRYEQVRRANDQLLVLSRLRPAAGMEAL